MSIPAALRFLFLKKTVPFAFPQELQSRLATQFLAHKAAVSSPIPPSPLPPAPVPTILAFSPGPVYTVGRRGDEELTPARREKLLEPLSHPRHLHPYPPSIVETLRGGQTTFHGPGQLVAYPILDIKSSYPLWPKGLSVRCYVNLLEQATIDTLALYGIKGIRTENPGVWDESGERKIAALGVHLRRNVTSYGIGLNVDTDLRWFDGIVGCGLQGKGTTSMTQLILEKGVLPEAELLKRRYPNRNPKRSKLRRHWFADQEGPGLGYPIIQDLFAKKSIGEADMWKMEFMLLASFVGPIWAQRFASLLYGESEQPMMKTLASFEELGLDEGEEQVIRETFPAYLTQVAYESEAFRSGLIQKEEKLARYLKRKAAKVAQKLRKLDAKVARREAKISKAAERSSKRDSVVRRVLMSSPREQEKQENKDPTILSPSDMPLLDPKNRTAKRPINKKPTIKVKSAAAKYHDRQDIAVGPREQQDRKEVGISSPMSTSSPSVSDK